MNETQKIPTSSKWILGGITLGIGLVLLFLFRSFIHEVIVLPIVYLIWLVGLTLASLDQSLLWLLLAAIAVILTFGALLHLTDTLQVRASSSPSHLLSGRVAYWMREISITSQVDYLHQDFRTALIRLICNALANQYRITPEEALVRIKNGDLDVPPQVYAYFQEKPQPLFPPRESRWRELGNYLKGLRNRQPKQILDPSTDPNLIALINYLEEQLEIKDDHSNR